jgi:hypothetical protein
MREAHERTKHCEFPPLVTTCTDGDNGGWFRNVESAGNFWGVFYQPLLELVRRGETEIRPVFIDEYLQTHGAQGYVNVREAAWNTGWHHGTGFTQWTGSQAQRDALQRIGDTSRTLHELRKRAGVSHNGAQAHQELDQAFWRILRAETSCNFFWGEAWVQRCHRDLDDAWAFIHTAEPLL